MASRELTRVELLLQLGVNESESDVTKSQKSSEEKKWRQNSIVGNSIIVGKIITRCHASLKYVLVRW